MGEPTPLMRVANFLTHYGRPDLAERVDTATARIAALETDLAEAVAVIEELRGWAPTCSQDADRADALLERLGQSEESA